MQEDARIGVFNSRREFDEIISSRNYFFAVLRGYTNVLETPPIVAISYDPDVPSRKLGAQMIEFLADCDIGVRVALNGNPSLIEDFARLLQGDKVPSQTDIINKVGREWRKRRLIPQEYFRVIKQGRKRPPTRAV
jgi:hypothetical protein